MPMHVMLVDDNSFVLEMLSRELRDMGIEAVCARDGYEALGRLQWDDYELLIADLQLPGIDGLAMVEQARRLYPHLRVIALAADDRNLEVKAKRSGLRVMRKPFSMVDFRKEVKQALQEARAGPPVDELKSWTSYSRPRTNVRAG